MFDTWMHRNGLSLSTAADALGISRRMVSYYRTAHKSIPRAIWLACLGWEATMPKPKTLPLALPTAREYVGISVHRDRPFRHRGDRGHGAIGVRSCFHARVLALPNLSGNLIDCKT